MHEMTYFRAELVQLIVSQSYSELEVQRYDMKKKYFDSWSYCVGRWIVNETMWKTIQTIKVDFFENQTTETEFRFLNFEVSSVAHTLKGRLH